MHLGFHAIDKFVAFTEAVVRRCSVNVFLKFFQNLGLRPHACNFIKKETLAQLLSYELCQILKNVFFHRKPPVAPSGKLNYKRKINLRFQNICGESQNIFQESLFTTS